MAVAAVRGRPIDVLTDRAGQSHEPVQATSVRAAPVEVVDIFEDLTPAIDDDIIAVPTVIRRSSTSTRRVAGILADTDRVLSQLQPPGRLTPSQGPQSTAHRPNRQVTDRGNAGH